MRSVIAKALASEAGVTAIEYAMIGALISISVVIGATKVGANLSGFFNAVATAFP